MSESMSRRVARLVSGGMNAMVDAFESMAPEAVMEQAIREVDEAIDDIRAELGRIIANKHLATRRLAEKNGRHEELSAQIEIAVANKRDELAETAIAAQLDLEAQFPVLERSITDAAERERELGGYIAALQARKREMQGELQAFRDSRRQPATGLQGAEPAAPAEHGAAISADRARAAFDRVLTRQTGLPASSRGDLSSGVNLQELERLTQQNRVQERLAAVKAKAARTD
ncbi:MAG TPA: PspA/IM30 family protein [Beijerinckiaceae bacterium]|jgi:phage shock protein A